MATDGDDGFEDVPTLLPTRMLNEFAYCPRLFYLEWVQQRWADSDDTDEGRYHHRAVDREEGAAPLPDDDDPLRAAKSVLLSSPALGLVARTDVIEADGQGEVRPVDVKRGKPPDVPEGAYEPERVQLCAQGLLLQDAGYACSSGDLYFADARRRVTIPFDDALIERTRSLAAQARQVAARDVAPLPLVDSPKCPRCSLVGICLPDEINALAERQQRPPRRLLPRDGNARPLYVSEQGARVGVSGGRVIVKRKEEKLASVRLIDVSQVVLQGNIQITTQAMRKFFARDVPICFLSYGGWFSGLAEGLPAKHVELRRRQVIVAGRGGLDVARQFVIGKIANQRTLLRRNARVDVSVAVQGLKEAQLEAAGAVSIAALLGIEGAAARTYFQAFTTMLSEDVKDFAARFDTNGRNRRPPKDEVNCLLSYVYSLLVKDLTAVVYTVGMDPYMGLFHRPRFGRPALALDLMEEFRALVADSVVVRMLNNGEVRSSHFIVRAGGVGLTADARRATLRAYERRLDDELVHPWFGYRASYRRLFEVQARILGAYLLGEVPAYAPLMTR